ncbi:unnamed protein product [Penicillium salamii]|uniref:Inheritance of peroxisomes protein 1 n=1 Tax=Penicillium salamii TaxID=1612424 RepID=A0A9W4J6N9_9EURO|nr:unnamed protein product [Penicillium salamii]CAG7986785.1 unnamed protein product [Penicillium salamii]CAG8168336.1 unnamed protein product [Penicillium salamii]CAG8232686.1 unnamed protein product [Penicillium salamii]CAG8245568.1 unnamed protein product [Penicillium salamii]
MPESPSELGQIQSLRRSVTLPVKLNPLTQRRASVPNTPEHVIYYHPSAKIVHFSPRALAPIPSSSTPSDFDYPVDTIETLPWRSATERTVATAPLRLEKVQGSTAFLKCGNVVHAILKNSQCWCVDGVSKFVLRIRPLTYYRIEIPYETGDDQSSVQQLKVALPTVLRYEVTPCPFKRSFSVELPSSLIAPRRKKAWRPKDQRPSVPAVLELPLEASSPSSTRSEWADSASTGDDTDGNLTDDSCFTSHKSNSTISEFSHDNHHLSPAETPRPSSSHSISRRSVSETPQTFTSLLAKFQATSLPEDCDSECGPEPILSQNVENTSSSSVEVSATPTDDVPLLPAEEVTRSSPGSNGTAGSPAEVEPHTEAEPDFETTSQPQTTVWPETTDTAPTESVLDTETINSTEPQIAVELHEPPREETEDDKIENFAEITLEVDHDASFNSSPESFHSAEPQSPDSVSTHPTSVGGPDLLDPTDMFSLPSAKDLINESELVSDHLCEKSTLPTVDQNQTDIPTSTSDHLSPNDLPKAVLNKTSDASSSVAHISGATPSTRTKDMSLETKMPSQSPSKAPASSTDFNHMSTEFRRRAQATREREVSPMPHSSALYKPSPGDDAKSFISKAITLVLIPPAYLFIIILHIAARVVINPPPAQPAVSFQPSGSNSNTRKSNRSPASGDDFDFPLEPQSSSEYEDAEIARKLDPWDLD